MIEKKMFNEYTIDEKKILLHHWFYYFSSEMIDYLEWKSLDELLDKDIEKVYFVAVSSFVYGYTTEIILEAIRDNSFDKLYESLPNVNNTDDEFKSWYSYVLDRFIFELVISYNSLKLRSSGKKEVKEDGDVACSRSRKKDDKPLRS